MNTLKDCILCSAENRWFDCWNLWIQTSQNYFNPESFRLNLNNCIQSLRTITWILQKSKSKIPYFDKWYGEWQVKMKTDPILEWAVDARNTIVKEGDLIIHSKARIAIIKNWFTPPILELDVPPFSNTNDFEKILSKRLSVKQSSLDGLLRVERRWVDSKLPKNELLDALAHTFRFLSEIILDAHESVLSAEDVKKCSWYHVYKPQHKEIHSSMSSIDWNRTIWIDLKSNQIVHVEEKKRKISKKSLKKAKERYSNCLESIIKIKESRGLIEEAKVFFKMAKEILIKDGHHSPIAILGYPNREQRLCPLKFDDRTEKKLVIYKLANIIKNTEATSLILINEAWVAPETNFKLTPNSMESSERLEALALFAIDAKGNEYHCGIVFEKKDNKIIFKEESEFNFKKYNINMLLPIKAVWKSK